MMNKTVKFTLIFISIIAYLISLSQECYLVNDKESIGSFGLIALLLGWSVIFDSFFSWLANPLYFLTIIMLFANKKIALLTGLFAVICSLAFLLVDKIIIDEAGNVGKIEAYLSGYWFWLTSITIVFLCAVFERAMSIKSS